MAIAADIQSWFSQVSRIKGDAIWGNASFQYIKGLGKNGAEFWVFGGDRYRVRISGNPSSLTLSVSCTCPYFEEGNACKHIWAGLFECNSKGYLQGIERYINLDLDDDLSVADDRNGLIKRGIANSSRNDKPPQKNSWKEKLSQVQKSEKRQSALRDKSENPKAASFMLDLRGSLRDGEIHLHFLAQEHLKNGKLGVLKPVEIDHSSLPLFHDKADAQILQDLLGRTRLKSAYEYYSQSRGWSKVTLSSTHAGAMLSEISKAGKLLLADKEFYSSARTLTHQPMPYSYSTEKWKPVVRLQRQESVYELSMVLQSSSGTRAPNEVLGAIDRFIFFRDFVAGTDFSQTETWLKHFGHDKIEIPHKEIDSFLKAYLSDPQAPELVLPDDLQFHEQPGIVPHVRVQFSQNDTTELVSYKLFFIYGTEAVEATSQTPFIFNIAEKKKLLRNADFENTARLQFADLMPMPETMGRSYDRVHGYFFADAFLAAAEKCLSWNWEVTANQKLVQAPNDFEMSIGSGVDWFELQAVLNFKNQKLSLPRLIAQLHTGSRIITLDDGTVGVLPQNWLNQVERLAKSGSLTKTGIKLSKVQALFLSAELKDSDHFTPDRKFRSLHDIVQEIRTVKPLDPPKNFKGKLRAYQKEGLSWLTVISNHGVGGILADDMGLGKTVQILALLAGIKSKAPHLMVAPKSLIFNWMQECKRFSPHLRVVDFTGLKRSTNFESFDIVLTTYQTLRSEVEALSQQQFASLILDEAHYVKNPKSQAAIACKLIKAPRKIALTGTPVENSLTDLFSILNIVNPGLFNETQTRSWSQERDPEVLGRLATALRPFLLRRTKENVLKDLPSKTEQVLYCELSPPERKRYDELRQFYWAQLNSKVEDKGLARSKIEVLEALLRLRQASCHHGLLDDELRSKPSAKFELLLDQIDSVIQDGRKALIFSQFTSLLALLKDHLNERNIKYEYLDGKTQDRQERVEKFQSDDSIKLFLLSLKAGGVGLNLTAADYVFILDPWWNPAAEAQAIDRTHRIGQTKKVFAYKIIAKDTVEEKILELQKSKKALAQAVVSDEKSILKNLTMSDLQILFS